MKDPRAVELCLELLEDEQLGMAALRALADLKSERAVRARTDRGRADVARPQRRGATAA
jgi:hypothetical protein